MDASHPSTSCPGRPIASESSPAPMGPRSSPALNICLSIASSCAGTPRRISVNPGAQGPPELAIAPHGRVVGIRHHDLVPAVPAVLGQVVGPQDLHVREGLLRPPLGHLARAVVALDLHGAQGLLAPAGVGPLAAHAALRDPDPDDYYPLLGPVADPPRLVEARGDLHAQDPGLPPPLDELLLELLRPLRVEPVPALVQVLIQPHGQSA